MKSITFNGVACAHCGLVQDIILPVENSRMEDQGREHLKNIYYLKKNAEHICAGCGAVIEWPNDRTSLNCIKK